MAKPAEGCNESKADAKGGRQAGGLGRAAKQASRWPGVSTSGRADERASVRVDMGMVGGGSAGGARTNGGGRATTQQADGWTGCCGGLGAQLMATCGTWFAHGLHVTSTPKPTCESIAHLRRAPIPRISVLAEGHAEREVRHHITADEVGFPAGIGVATKRLQKRPSTTTRALEFFKFLKCVRADHRRVVRAK